MITAQYLNLMPAEQAKASAVTRRTISELQKIDDEEIALRKRLFAYEQRPTAAAKARFHQRREAAVLQGVREMQRDLGSAWVRLQAHINGVHRASTRVWIPQGKQ
ncbi:MAG: hypothetical protein JNL98_12260 [Bryobacterales bacterium]|nr:hypothetical protein [Bryobacterales bacterium]